MSRATSNKLEMLKMQLEKVKPAGKGWIARCPGHDDKEQSLSLAIGRNGGVLLNCFRGCDKVKVLEAMGLTLEDLFDNKPFEEMNPQEKAEAHNAFMQAKWATALKTLQREAMFLDLVVRSLAAGEELDAESKLRLQRDVHLLDEAFVVLNTGPARPRMEKFRPPDDWMDAMADAMPKKSGWQDPENKRDDKVPSTRGGRTPEPATDRRHGFVCRRGQGSSREGGRRR